MTTAKFSSSEMACIIDSTFDRIQIHDPKEIDDLIKQLQEAKQLLIEHKARLAEEGYNLWENS